MTTDLSIPAPDQLTADWLTAALRSTGTIRKSRVTSFAIERDIAAGAGFMGELTRIAPTYDQPEDGAPQTIIGKFPAAQPENREVAMRFRFYERETRFYQEIAQKVELRTPRLYYSAFDPASGAFVLLLEDMAWARLGDQLAGCTAEQAQLCLNQLATFHAAWWEHPELAALDWMPLTNDPLIAQSAFESYQEAWPAFKDLAIDKLSPARIEIGERFGRRIIDLMDRFGQQPRTIIHGDYRLDNLFFGNEHGGHPLTVIDWQIASRGRGVFDVAYFTCGTMPPAERKRAELEILKEYHRTLAERGVRDYDFATCLEDYRAAVLFCLVYSVIGIGNLDLANERGVELFFTIAERTYSAIEDLDADEFLSS